MTRSRVHRVVLACIGSLVGCTVGPDYVQPVVATPAAYRELADWKVAQPGDELPRGRWWEIFGDADLNALVAQIAAGNLDVHVAEARLRQARALARQARAGYFPAVSGNASVARGRTSGTGQGGGVSTLSRTATDYSVSLDASWELDLFGRVRRSVESREAGAEASAADLESVRLAAQAELALDYFALRVADAQQQLLQDSVAAYEKSLQVVRNMYAAGTVSRADVAQGETQLKSVQAQALDVGLQRVQIEHAIAVLLGKAPADFTLPRGPLALPMPPIPVGLPAELLERRPDIAAAERRVAAANAQIGVAMAAFYPSLTLSGAIGFRNTSLSDWITAPSRFWSVGPSLAQTLFDGGLRGAVAEQARAAYDEDVVSYRQTVLFAFQEVEDNLAALHILGEEAVVQDEAVRAAQESVTLTTNQYRAGTVSYLAVVLVQTVALTNQRLAVGILGRRLAASVALVKAIGGGWRVGDPAAPSPM